MNIEFILIYYTSNFQKLGSLEITKEACNTFLIARLSKTFVPRVRLLEQKVIFKRNQYK